MINIKKIRKIALFEEKMITFIENYNYYHRMPGHCIE